MNKKSEEKTPNKFVVAIKIVLVKYNIGLMVLALVTALAYAISSV